MLSFFFSSYSWIPFGSARFGRGGFGGLDWTGLDRPPRLRNTYLPVFVCFLFSFGLVAGVHALVGLGIGAGKGRGWWTSHYYSWMDEWSWKSVCVCVDSFDLAV